MAEMNIDITNAIERAIEKIRHEGYTVQKWISCAEQLPEKNQMVLVFCKAIGEANNIHKDAISTNKRKASGDFIPCAGYKITHWMPMPEPPEAGESNDKSNSEKS